eukprot:jgi/Bigna1/144993/aug1.93_g19701
MEIGSEAGTRIGPRQLRKVPGVKSNPGPDGGGLGITVNQQSTHCPNNQSKEEVEKKTAVEKQPLADQEAKREGEGIEKMGATNSIAYSIVEQGHPEADLQERHLLSPSPPGRGPESVKRKILIDIQGMTCSNCSGSIERLVADIQGAAS